MTEQEQIERADLTARLLQDLVIIDDLRIRTKQTIEQLEKALKELN